LATVQQLAHRLSRHIQVIGELGDIQPAWLDDLLPKPNAGMNGEATMKLNGHQ
jgi:hypothetical protein